MTDGGWSFTSHCCRACLGRVVERADVFRCATCGAEADRVEAICACGLRRSDGRPLGFRCVVNAQKSPAVPAEIVAAFGELVAAGAA
jgi:predicted amidophosphoribosyltransferase